MLKYMSSTCTSGQNSLLKFELSILYGYTTRRDNHDDAKRKVLAVRVWSDHVTGVLPHARVWLQTLIEKNKIFTFLRTLIKNNLKAGCSPAPNVFFCLIYFVLIR